MRAMAVQALTRRVHHHRGRVALILQVTAPAIVCAEGLEHTAVQFVVWIAVARECVAIDAIGFRAVPESRLRLLGCMLDARFAAVTTGTSAGCDRSDRRALERVAAVASDALLHHMHLMASRAPIRGPRRLHVEPLARAASFTGLTRGTGCCQHATYERGEQDEELKSMSEEHCFHAL